MTHRSWPSLPCHRSLQTSARKPRVILPLAGFLLAILLLAVASSIAATADSSGTAKLTWAAPTKNTDGTALTDLAGYRIHYGTDATNLSQTVQVADPAATTYTIANLAPAGWYFAITAYNSAGQESAPSSTVSKTIAAALPAPPANLAIQDQTVYTLVKVTDGMVMLVVGSVPAATPCLPTQAVVAAGVTYYVVPRATVSWGGSIQPQVVFARCRAE